MEKKNKKILLTILACLIAVLGVLCGVYFPESNVKDKLDDMQNSIVKEIETLENKNEVIVPEEAQGEISDTKEATQNGKDISTKEIIESSIQEEQQITDEGALEVDATVEQENISYNGDSTGNGLSLLGSYQGLTYYSQADSRWANTMYSSVGDSSQTMKSSACGPTSAAVVVSSSKGAILPTTLASLAVSNGYRTSNNGTAWAFFPFVADYFDFKEFYTTSNFDTAMKYLKTDADNDGNADYYIVVSCGSGLFTSGGHYIVLVANNSGTITVYDPYLYNGKFTTASRRNAGVVVSGNSAYVSESSFKNYANYKYFWIFSNDKGNGNTNISNNTNVDPINYTRYVSTQSSNLNVRSGASLNSSIITSLVKGTKVIVTKVDGNWSYITSPKEGWVSTNYLSASPVFYNFNQSINYNTTAGNYYKLKSNTTLYANSSMSGIYYNYLAGTKIKVISHISSNVDYIYVVKTGRYAYCYTNAFVSNSINDVSYSTTKGKYYTLKSNTILYSNGTLNGTRYNYLYGTKVKVVSHYSRTIDYIYVPKTGRYAYCKVNALR